jgi:hypothetical protein
MDSKPIRERQIMPVVSRCCRDRLSDFAVTSVPPHGSIPPTTIRNAAMHTALGLRTATNCLRETFYA